MKAKKVLILGLTFALVVFGTAVVSQAAETADQTVTFTVSAINEIAVVGDVTLTIDSATAGGAIAPATDASTTYGVTTNGTGKKITANLSEAMPVGLTLEVNLAAPTDATSTNYVDISAVGAKDVVTGISNKSESDLGITYRLTALPTAAPVSAATRTVTFTLTDAS